LNNCRNSARIADVFERIGLKKNEIATLSFLDCAQFALQTKKLRCAERRSAKCIRGRETSPNQ
jgi:hypothetical protein